MSQLWSEMVEAGLGNVAEINITILHISVLFFCVDILYMMVTKADISQTGKLCSTVSIAPNKTLHMYKTC